MKFSKINKKIFRTGLYSILLLILLITGIYAWIYGDSAPSITGNMKIGDTSGLVFEINSVDTKMINLNENLGLSTANMILNEVSSADGMTFVKRNTTQFFQERGNPNKNEEIITFLDALPNSREATGNEEYKFVGDYVHLDVSLNLEYAEEGAKYYIYFLDGSLGSLSGFSTGFKGKPGSSLITEDGLKALRASLKVNGAHEYGPDLNNDNHLAIFGNAGETVSQRRTQAVVSTQTLNLRVVGVEDEYSVQTAGTYYIDYLNGMPGTYGQLTDGMNVCSFSKCAIDGVNGLSGEVCPNSDYLFVLDEDCRTVQLSLNLWLEGGSIYCQNSDVFIEDNIQFDMFLVAYKVNEG